MISIVGVAGIMLVIFVIYLAFMFRNDNEATQLEEEIKNYDGS